jgi:DNA-directed RNA polymerase omega subunit
MQEVGIANVENIATGEWPGIVSRFQLVILAGMRSKQLLRGAQPRIAADKLKRRNTSIALEELRRGLVPFQAMGKIQTKQTAIEELV